MKKLSSVLSLFFVLMFFIALCPTLAAADEGGSDPAVPVVASSTVQTARGLLAADGLLTKIDCRFQFSENAGVQKGGEFTLQLDGPQAGFISRFVFEGEELVGENDLPLPGFPFFKKGMKSFSVSIDRAYSSVGDSQVYGNFFANDFGAEMPIIIKVQISWLPLFISYPEGRQGLAIRWQSGSGRSQSMFQQEHRGFEIWVDPTVAYTYEIVDTLQGDMVIARGGPLFYGQGGNAGPNHSPLGVVYPAGIKPLNFLNNECFVDGLKPETETVYLLEVPAGHSLYGVISLSTAATGIRLYRYVPEGDLPEVPAEENSWQDETGTVYRDLSFYLPPRTQRQRLIFQITDSAQPFWFMFRRTPQEDVGGKG